MAVTAGRSRATMRLTTLSDRAPIRHLDPVLLVTTFLLTTIGAKTGAPRVTPLNFSVDGDRLVAIASAGGSSRHPGWYRNLVANPDVTIELGTETFHARASTAVEPEQTRLYDQQAARMTFFAGYRRQVKTRQIPVVVFEAMPGVVGGALRSAGVSTRD